ncbi:MICOS complex subunit mic25-a-like [Amphiura filiformis]|uniref:MICOS complex subunit mic25-a-like n=1 Tax=Amphiura filiformis TaxID=82378 RepID=UPI003B227463
MGGASSSETRKITVEQDAETGMVKISEDVLKRMIGEEAPRKVPQQHTPERRTSEVPDEVWHERLRQVEAEWRERLERAERKNASLQQLTQDEFKKASEEVEAKFMKFRYNPVCQNLQDDLAKCYSDNPGRTLNCSQQVREFNHCVEQARTSILTKRSLQAGS